jgi:predicted GNAT family N-acyltransferase
MYHGIHYEFTKDPDLLHQYYALVKKCYYEDLNVDLGESRRYELIDKEYEYNSIGHIIVARVGNYVIGGARMVISSKNYNIMLPMEGDDFSLKDIFPEYSLDEHNYGELGRLAVFLDFRGREIVQNILYKCISLAISYECSYGFWIAPITQSLYYKKILNKYRIKSKIHYDINFPYRQLYKNIKGKIVLGSCDLTFSDLRDALPDNIWSGTPYTVQPSTGLLLSE